MEINAYALFSPYQNTLEFSSVRFNEASVRDYAIEISTVFGGEKPKETWKSLYNKGYRVVPIHIYYPLSPRDEGRAITRARKMHKQKRFALE